MFKTLALTAALFASVTHPPLLDDPHREFDFWIGEWSVLNRHMDVNGNWNDGDTTRARITPVCGDRAVLEEWAGTFGGSFMNGFSLRAYDPSRERWQLLLSWTTTGNDGFGRMFGAFHHGRGEFFSTTLGPNRLRYTFSDGLADSVRWDSASTSDGGVNWKTSWIMEFSRTRAAEEVTQDELFATDWTTGEVSPHPEARALDGMFGEWTGTQTRADGEVLDARLRARPLNKDCLVVDVLELSSADSEETVERLFVRGFVAGNKRWEAWRVSESDTVLREFTGVPQGNVARFAHADTATGAMIHETITLGDDTLKIVESAALDGTDAGVVLSTTRLTRQR